MKISKQARRDAKHLFRNCVVDGLLDDNRVRQTVARVISQEPRGYVGILSHFQRLVKLDLERRSARVETAVAPSPQLTSQIQASLERRYGRGLSLSFQIQPALIGGMRVKVGSDVFDGSIQARLSDLQNNL